MDVLSQGPGVDLSAAITTTPALLRVEQATLFVTELGGAASEMEILLSESLLRLQVLARDQRVVALMEQPLLGRQCRVRVTPCLVLNTGSRLVTIPGDLQQLNPARLEAALSSP
jgi:hypothetical protein